MYISKTTLKDSSCCFLNNISLLESELVKFGPIMSVTRHGGVLDIVYQNSEDATRALLASQEGKIIVSDEKVQLTRAIMDPDSVEFKNMPDEWKDNLVKAEEKSYVFTDVAWSMYQLIPVNIRPQFWLQFEEESYIDRYSVIFHYMITNTLRMLNCTDVLEKILVCPKAKSLARRTEYAINKVYAVSIPSINEIWNGHSISFECLNVTTLYYNGKPFDFHTDIELSESIDAVIERMKHMPELSLVQYSAIQILVKLVQTVYKSYRDPVLTQELHNLIHTKIMEPTIVESV